MFQARGTSNGRRAGIDNGANPFPGEEPRFGLESHPRSPVSPPLPSQLDPKRMELTEEERQWALAIKERITSDPEIDDISDLMCAQLAIVAKDDVEEAARRAWMIHQLREELSIRDCYEEGKRAFQKMMEYWPGVVLSFYFHEPDASYCMVFDSPKFRGFKTHEKFHLTLLITHYFCQVLNPDIEATRKGAIFFGESEGYSLHSDMIDVALFRRVFVDFYASYPMNFQQIKMFHTPIGMNLLVSLVRKAIPAHITSKFRVGCRFEGGRLDKFYQLPTPAIAAGITLEKLLEALQLRYENERSFKL